MEASLSIQILPKTDSEEELLRIVDKVICYIESTGLKTFTAPFDTTVEGDFDTLCEIIKKSHQIAIDEGAEGVSCNMKLYYTPEEKGGVLTIEEKVSPYHKSNL